MGNLLIEKGEFEEGEALLRRELDAVEAREGGKSEQIIGSLSNLGNKISGRGRISEAETLLRRALDIEEASVGPEHKDVMVSLSNLGGVLRRAGRYDDAEKEFARAVEIAEKLNFGGPFFPMAELRMNQKRYEDAVTLLQRCLEIRRRKLDPADEAISGAIRKLADVYHLMGRDTDAEEMERELPASDPYEGTA